jgi:hypothetical protein
MNSFSPSAAIVGLAVALGIGVLVGIERERRKGDGDRRAAAGLRTWRVLSRRSFPFRCSFPSGERSSPRWRLCRTGRAARKIRA